MKFCLKVIVPAIFISNVISERQSVGGREKKEFVKRHIQQTVPNGGICSTMIPPSSLPPDNSSCWQWWDAPANGIILPGSPTPPKGCNYQPCQNAVCNCDPYCCESAWDLSCRGYFMTTGDTIENNYFVAGCSAKLLCCEPESAYPDPPIGGALPPVTMPALTDNSYACIPGSGADCCVTMVPASYLAPDDSSCWQWWDVPSNGILPPGSPEPPKGCNYKPCQEAVCACDSYCCTTAWDLSCRGYQMAPGDSVENNYFVNGCSAKILCCEQESAYPDPPFMGAGGSGISVGQTDIDVTVTETTAIGTTTTNTYIVATGYETKGGKKGSYDASIYGAKKGSSDASIYGAKKGSSVGLIYTGAGKGDGKGARRNRRRQ